MEAGHTFEAHTGEVRLHAWGPTREALFAEAGRGLAELMLGRVPESAGDPVSQEIAVSAPDAGALLVEWLNELIFRSDVSKQVFTHFDVERASNTHVRGTVQGVHPEVLKTAVKAATLHEVSVRPFRTGWRARVVLDV